MTILRLWSMLRFLPVVLLVAIAAATKRCGSTGALPGCTTYAMASGRLARRCRKHLMPSFRYTQSDSVHAAVRLMLDVGLMGCQRPFDMQAASRAEM